MIEEQDGLGPNPQTLQQMIQQKMRQRQMQQIQPFQRDIGIKPVIHPRPKTENEQWKQMNYDAGREEPPDLPSHPRINLPAQAEPLESFLAELLMNDKMDGGVQRGTIFDMLDEAKGVRNRPGRY